ncbi:MAG: methyltransferase [Candidatus Omnitrophica bacterium]|nr:methyltransferase [Candidatus Omnitrophota bacterium]
MPLVNKKLEDYALAHSASESRLLKDLARETYAKTEIPQMQVGHLEGSFLRMIVKIARAKTILEIGTFTGYSALCMAEGLSEDGKIITCDINPETSIIAQKYWAKSPHGKKIRLCLGPAVETLKKIHETMDMVFIDADKENYLRYWELCLPKVRRGGILLADNVLWSGRVLNPKSDSDHAIVKFNRHVMKDKRVEVLMLPLRDGITLAYKR